MSSTFMNSNRDHKFILKEWLDMSKVFETERFRGGYSVDDLDFILDNALKGAREVVAAGCKDSDQIGARFENGRVITPQSTKDGYFFIMNNGFGATNADPHDESALPQTVVWAINEFMIGANPSIATLWLAGSGAAGLIEDFGSEELKRTYLPKIYSGQWAATMDLTEPSAGSDVGDLTTRAIPTGTPGVYKIKGTKCFISGGEQDVTENIIHLTLARIEGAAPGTRGISLFVIPKYLPDEQGNPGAFNDVSCAGIEHKLGLRGSPTCVINFGEEDNCLGFLIGDPPGEDGAGQGMAQMFKMMNEERLMSGVSGLALAAVAYHNAARYASERIQGRATSNPRVRAQIIKHEDVRRMLLFQKAHIEAFRAMALATFYQVDIEKWSADEALVRNAKKYLEVNTPIVKAYCSDMALRCISEALQIYGGYGFSEEYPVAELYRDARIYPIWEGTNYIQALDLVGRKMTMKKGQVFAEWLQEIQDFIDAHRGAPGLEREFQVLQQGMDSYRQVHRALGELMARPGMVQLYATRVLHATGKLYAGRLLLDQALLAQKRMAELGPDHFDYPFYAGKVASARFYVHNIVPEIGTLAAVIANGDTSAIDLVEEAFFV
ncbi:MAG: acyl-CoA dehydrogenase [Syntrophomonadaceae bacterium]|jgi:alkylation response protein AidB-like acyl-CoA dehydrogenase|nr:acyl-CoA dehydrogenase [Syntrophomonadaceae bacterium]MDH7497988.1 acyl-CoA dehydrogenase [Syntrophomonadaceae bacterium]